ncbi:hypothetical protein, partial [Phenylobacterium sp.]|uniref:hypothetical protein n=1 Tax=Phenylobacterium sp. TaxID=1871053 RepID=UPI00286AB49C
DPAALAECDRTLNRLRALEPIRSAFAHGLPYVKGQDHDGAIEVRRYSADDTKPGARKAELTTYTLDEIDAAAREVREIAEWLGPFSQRYTAPFVLKTFASHNANSLAPTSPLNSGQSASSRSLSQAARYGSSISAIAITSGDKPLKK